MILDSLRCLLFGHVDTVEIETRTSYNRECTRCNAVLDNNYKYKFRATRALEQSGFPQSGIYTPVEQATRGDMVLEPGDRLCYTIQSAFPGLKNHRQATVNYIYESPGLTQEIEYTALVDREWDPVTEHRWVGFRKAGDGPAPTPGLTMY